jgi:1,4-alpha-glucan branching enzyme
MTRNYRESVVTRFADAARVHFELFHPTAKRVFIAGSFNGWNPSATAMASAGHGKWLRELWLLPGEHEYLLVVDGEWVFDPRSADYAPNVFGGMNAVVQARSPAKGVPREWLQCRRLLPRAEQKKASLRQDSWSAVPDT